MGKFRKGGYIFFIWRGYHPTRHVQVFKEGRLVLKWNLEDDVAMKEKATARIRSLINHLKKSGKL